MKLRNHVGGLCEERRGEILAEKRSSDNTVIDKKENAFNKKYNLRAQNTFDCEKKSSNQNLKKLSNKNKVDDSSANLGIQGKENKRKKRSKRAMSQNCSINLKNRSIHNVDVTSEHAVNYTVKLPFWRNKSNINKSKCGIKRKSFVDVYDISQDEDMSSETKLKKKKFNSKKNVKRPVNKNKCLIISNKNANFNQKYSNTSKPVHNRLNKLVANLQSNAISSKPTLVKVSTTAFLPDKKSEINYSVDIVEDNAENCAINANVAVNIRNTNDDVNITNTNDDANITYTHDDMNVTSALVDIDNAPSGTKSQEGANNFILTFLDEFGNSLLFPRMTSTPDSTMLSNPMTKHLQSNKLTELDISSIIPKSKNCLQIPVKICNLPDKETDITLFESPFKKLPKKDPIKFKSPKKSIQINLFEKYTEQPKVDNLENSVLQPRKAYHSPDNFKTHLARTKRVSEVMKKETHKSKEEMLIETMAQHFEDISSTELCIE